MALAMGGALLVGGPDNGRAQQRSTAKPKLPPGAQRTACPSRCSAAGVDYVRPEIASRLFRDGEGEAGRLDAIDSDLQPFERPPEPGPPGTSHGGGHRPRPDLLRKALNASLIPVRIPGAERWGLPAD